MSPVVKQKGERFTLPSKYLLFILSILCVILLIITYKTNFISNTLNSVAGVVVIPFEKGISRAGVYLSNRTEQLKQINELLSENERLQKQVDELTVENTKMQQERYELTALRELFQLKDDYADYQMTGAHVIARDAGNWFYSFVIDKGSNDGIEKDMNVLAGGGLVGRVVDVGNTWSKVKAIIADDSNVSAKILSTSDNMIVSGSLEQYASGQIPFTQLLDNDNQVAVGDKVVTSNISDKFLPGILIGYVHEINTDANNLTKSGSIIPAVDFEHIEDVLIILEQKQYIEEDKNQNEEID